MPANYLIAGMARSYKVILPKGELCEKREDHPIANCAQLRFSNASNSSMGTGLLNRYPW